MLPHLVNSPPLLGQSGGGRGSSCGGIRSRFKYISGAASTVGGGSNSYYKRKVRSSKERLFHEGPYYAKFLVPDSVASILMGPQGSNIISVESPTQTSIRFSPRGHYFPNSKLRILVIAARSLNMLTYLVRILITEYILSTSTITSTTTTTNNNNYNGKQQSCVYISVIGQELLNRVMEHCKPFVDPTLSMIYHTERIICLTLSSHFGDINALVDTCNRAISIMQYDDINNYNNTTTVLSCCKNIRLIYPSYSNKDYRTFPIMGMLDDYECMLAMNVPSFLLKCSSSSSSSCEFFRAVAEAHNIHIHIVSSSSAKPHHQQQQGTTTSTPSLFALSCETTIHEEVNEELLLDFDSNADDAAAAAHVDNVHAYRCIHDVVVDDDIFSSTISGSREKTTSKTVLNYPSLQYTSNNKNISESILVFKGKITDIHSAQSAICAGVW